MTPQEIFDKLAARFGAAVSDFHADAKDPWCIVRAEALLEAASWLRDEPEMRFDFLQNLTGVDYPKEGKIAVVYHLFSYPNRHAFQFKVMADRQDPLVPSLYPIWRVAGWHERECYDLLGVFFDGHPDLRRLLLPDDWVGHPLRKDYAEAEHYHGIPTTRPNPIDLFQVSKKGAAS
ncbi:MAG: NADH-quinone oxidoreductase subunit C [Deltaproteobacteria bacterium]|nr:NADH-quinone oxidoreductase subunit C [Deltaproteobacteria bacterium]